MIHLALDFSNNYGVHPFWPVSNRWFYGDAIFIVEPWFWVVAIPLLLPSFRSRAGQVFFGLLLGVAIVVPWVAPFVPALERDRADRGRGGVARARVRRRADALAPGADAARRRAQPARGDGVRVGLGAWPSRGPRGSGARVPRLAGGRRGGDADPVHPGVRRGDPGDDPRRERLRDPARPGRGLAGLALGGRVSPLRERGAFDDAGDRGPGPERLPRAWPGTGSS